MADGQLPRRPPLCREVLHDGGDGGLRAGEHHRRGPVDGGEVGLLAEQGHHLVLRGGDGDHRAALRQGLHEPSSGGHERRGVVEGEHSADVGGGQFTDGVPGQEGGFDPPGLHEPEQRHFEREQRGLGVLGTVERLGVVEDIAQGPGQVRVEGGAHRLERLRVRGVGAGQLAAHTGALRALSREQEGDRGRLPGESVDGRRRRLPVGQGPQGVARAPFVARGGHDHGSVRVGAPGGDQVTGQFGQSRVGLGGQVVQEAPGLCAQRRPAACGQEDRNGGRGLAGLVGGGRARGGRRGLGSLLDDHVGVGAAEAEGGHSDPSWPVDGGPLLLGGEERHVSDGPVDLAGRLVHVQRLRQLAVPDAHHGLDHTGNSGRRLGVAQVGLDGAQPQRPVGGPVLPVGGEQRLRLDRVAERGGGAVGLHSVDLVAGELCVAQRLADDPLLGRSAGGGHAVRRAVLVDGAAPDDGEDRVPVATGVGQTFQEQYADAFGPSGAVRRVGEGPAAAVAGEGAVRAELDEGPGGGHHGHPARERERALALPQRLDRLVQRDQGRRARRVDGHRRSFETEGVGDPAGEDAGRTVAAGVVVVHDAGEDTGGAALEGHRVDARAFGGLPRGLQEQALLRVHQQRLAGADPEEVGVEPGRTVQEPALADVARAGPLALGVVEPVQVPAPVLRERPDAVPALGRELPQVLGRSDASGEPAGHADDRDRLVGCGRELSVLFPQPLGLLERHTEGVKHLLVGVVHCALKSLASCRRRCDRRPGAGRRGRRDTRDVRCRGRTRCLEAPG